MSFKKNKTKTFFQIFSLFLIIFGILFLLSFITTSNKDLKITGYVGGIPPSECPSSGTCDINECGNLSINGMTYKLTQDLVGDGTNTCFNVNAPNTILDCQGHSITNVDTGIFANAGGTIQDCNIIATRHAIYLDP